MQFSIRTRRAAPLRKAEKRGWTINFPWNYVSDWFFSISHRSQATTSSHHRHAFVSFKNFKISVRLSKGERERETRMRKPPRGTVRVYWTNFFTSRRIRQMHLMSWGERFVRSAVLFSIWNGKCRACSPQLRVKTRRRWERKKLAKFDWTRWIECFGFETSTRRFSDRKTLIKKGEKN